MTVTDAKARQVQAALNYIERQDEELYNYYFMEPPPGKKASTEVKDPHTVTITSVRDIPRPDLHVQGFELVPFSTATKDIYDAAERDAVFNHEVAAMVKEHTGAIEVRCYYPFLRGEEAQRRQPGAITLPAGTTHVDYTHESGPGWFERMLGEDADEFRGRRFAIINVWRPITGPMQDYPLAFCDVQTMKQHDLMRSKSFSLVNADGTHGGDSGHLEQSEIYSVAYNPDHRWYYVPDMMPDEALLLKNYDSEQSGVSRFCPHSAFEDPTAPADRLPRASIEVRALTIW